MSLTHEAKDRDDLAELLTVLDTKPEEAQRIDQLDLEFTPETFTEEAKRLLWSVLSHPYSKINSIELAERVTNALDDSGIATYIKRWCEVVPAITPRRITLNLTVRGISKPQDKLLDAMRKALTAPNNRVEELTVIRSHRAINIGEALLRPVLENPNNNLKVLDVHTEDTGPFLVRPTGGDDEMVGLAQGLSSPACKVEVIRVYACDVADRGSRALVTGLSEALHLESIERLELKMGTIPLDVLARLIERPGNCLKMLSFKQPSLSEQEQVARFADALCSEHCRLEELDWREADNTRIDNLRPLVRTLRHPNTRLTTLTVVGLSGRLTASDLSTTLQSPECKLHSLILRDMSTDEAITIAIAEALKVSVCTRLQVLNLHGIMFHVGPFMAESLRSPHNKLRELCCKITCYMQVAQRNDLRHAVRVSNLWRIANLVLPQFDDAFNAPFFEVLHTLLSIKHVPRLGEHTFLRLLPVQDFILNIAETLGWPLDDLRPESSK